MQIHTLTQAGPRRLIRRTAALLCAAALAGVGLAGRAGAQVTGPLPTSPPQPTPFQSPLFHSGGANTPYAGGAYLTPLIDPIQGQLQGTPTELYNGNLTQIPSFLLGNYDPTRPPGGLSGGAGTINTYYPNHFADGTIYSWAAPFSYASQSAGTVTVDDTGAVAPSTFTSNGFAAVTDPVAFPAAGTATNGEYLRIGPVPLASGDTSIYRADWTLAEPAAGSYSLYFHIPNDLPDASGNPEPRDTRVVYFIAVRDAAGNVTSTTTATASQTEANDSQFLAGPFQVASGGTVGVSLIRSNTVNNNADYLVADSMTLQATVGDVQSAPTAITHDLFPVDFESTAHPLQYWGIFVPPGSSTAGFTQTVGGTVGANANPDTDAINGGNGAGGATNQGNILLRTGNTAAAVAAGGVADPLRRIRQLVYFGRSDPSASRTSSVDDSSATRFTSTAGSTITNATASNGEYRSFPVQAGATPTYPVATWTVPVPTGGGSSLFVYAHIPALSAGETRLARVYYTVTVGGTTLPAVAISQVTQGADALVVLPTGPIAAAAGSSIVVKMFNINGGGTNSPTGTVVVADSVSVSTGTGQGAIYCVDGFTGGVVWRYETPGAANGSSAPVFASPAVARINVLVTPPVYSASGAVTTPGVYANRLVVIVGDNNGLVYCLDAIGNGDGTSNADVLALDASGNPIPTQPITVAQPAYGGAYGATGFTPLVAGIPAATAATTAHVGTTGVYWIYRPDATKPKYIAGGAGAVGTVKPVEPNSDLPVPAAFNTASPNVFVDPTKNTNTANGALASNAIVYVGNSNGVLYALDAGGVGIDGATTATFAKTGDTFNVSQDLEAGTTAKTPTCQPLWWFSLRGPDPNSATNASSADIESAPAVYAKTATTGGVTTYVPSVYIGSAHEMESTSNVGRLYALNGLYGPSGNNGRNSSDPAATTYAPPGSLNYNVGQRPQTGKADTADWSFPDAVGTDAYSTGKSSSRKPRPALGNITGSPVVFTNVNATSNATRVYFAANSGLEPTSATPNPTARPDSTLTGRVWAVNLDGSVGTTTNSGTGVWAYPAANDPNNAGLDTTPEPYSPIGAFLRATPAIGFVQFPLVTTNGDGSAFNPADAVHTGGISGQEVPMLYVGTRGVNDSSLYAVDIDGVMTAGTDTRTIYRVVSPSGSIFQSSPALVTNASSAGGNGGSVYVTAGSSLYDYGATPISNPFAGQAYPLIRQNNSFIGFGPISSPALAGANTTDLSGAFLGGGNTGIGSNQSAFTENTTDWVYVGDSSTGLCRGITPNDPTYGGVAVGLGGIVPPSVNAPSTPLKTAFIQTFLESTSQTSATSADAEPVGAGTALPVFEWGQSAWARFTNVAPPNPTIDPTKFVYDHVLYNAAAVTNASATNPVPFYTSDGTTAQTVTFSLSDADTTTATPLLLDNGSVQPVLIGTPPDGFVPDAGTLPGTFSAAVKSVVQNLATANDVHYLGTYTYTIADGTARNNTPGARRRFQNVKQTVTEYDFTNATGDNSLTNIANYTKKDGTTVIGGDATNENIVTNPGGGAFTKVAAVDQPTFGILNPLAVRGGSVSLLAPGTVAVPVGDEAGPFRGVPATLTAGTGGTDLDRQALANGNDIPLSVPPSSSGVGGDPTRLPGANGSADPTGVNTGTFTHVVVTATGLIPHNTLGDNAEPSGTVPTGQYGGSGTDGLASQAFGGYGLNVFDRGALFNLGQTLRVKMGVPDSSVAFAPPANKNGLYWNSNFGGSNPDTTPLGTGAVVNFLPWEVPPTPYQVGGNPNGSPDYPSIAPGNITSVARSISGSSGGDLSSNGVTLPQGVRGTGSNPIQSRVVTGDPVQVRISVPHYQPANQQLYQQPPATASGQAYNAAGQIAPVTEVGANQINPNENVFPMGYVVTQRLFVPAANGFYNAQRPYRDVRVYTGVPVDMQTSVANPTTDIGRVPATFGVQTEQYTTAFNPAITDPLGFFTPYSASTSQPSPFLDASKNRDFFRPLDIHNDGNVNLLNVHLDQKMSGTSLPTLLLNSDAVDPLSFLGGFDVYSVTGSQNASGERLSTSGTTTPLPGTNIPEQSFLVRSSVDTDLVRAYGRNPYILSGYSALYPGATFHKPPVGGDQPSTLTVPDAPAGYVAGASLPDSPTGTPMLPGVNGTIYKAPPYVSIAIPFGTPVGTYATPGPQDANSLRLFEGLDTAGASEYAIRASVANPYPFLYPPRYGTAIGGVGTPYAPPTDVYNPSEPLSTSGTQLTGTVVEQRMTDGFTFGGIPPIEGGPAGTNGSNAVSTPDFAPAAFRDPATGTLSLYWTSGRGGPASYQVYGMEAYFNVSSQPQTRPGYFYPNYPPNDWWSSTGGYSGIAGLSPLVPVLPGYGQPAGAHSGFSVTQDIANPSGAVYGFDVDVTGTAPYNNTLYCYTITPGLSPQGGPAPGGLTSSQQITPDTNGSQVKYGVRGLSTGSSFTNNLWAFWTGATRGRTALYYNSRASGTGGGAWPLTTGLLPVPAGLTAVADASPLLMPAPGGSGTPFIEVTYSGTAPGGDVDLYVSRYQPGATAATASQLSLVPFPFVTEKLAAAPGGWYQSRDVAWSRAGVLNVTVPAAGGVVKPLFYNASNSPLYTSAIYDKASGLLVLTGVKVPQIPQGGGAALPDTTNTVYVDAATGRIRFSPPLLTATTQNFGPNIEATFSPLARRLTADSLADTGPVTFLDTAQKVNDSLGLPNVEADRRWTLWRKSAARGAGSAASLYYKTQRLTAFLPYPVDTTKALTITLGGAAYSGPVDVENFAAGTNPGTSASARLFFQIDSGAEGQTITYSYTGTDGRPYTGPATSDRVRWQDEIHANDPSAVPFTNSTDALFNVSPGYAVPIQTAVNENNVAAFLDPYASATSAHKVWLFWNSTRNGTADIYSETIDPRFGP